MMKLVIHICADGLQFVTIESVKHICDDRVRETHFVLGVTCPGRLPL